MLALKDLMTALGSANLDCRQDGAAIDPQLRTGYLFNTTIAGIDEADACLLIGTNPRWEAPIINARLRKRWLTGRLSVGLIGPKLDLTYKYDHLGAGPQTLQHVADGRHPFADVLRTAKRPMLVLGTGALQRADGAAVLHLARTVAETFNMIQPDWNGFNLLHTAAARVGALDIGFVPGRDGRDVANIIAGVAAGEIDVVYLLGVDEIAGSHFSNAFVIYQGHHGDVGAHRADVVLPGAAYTEKDATYVNTEGRVQRTALAAFPPGDAREDWTIIRALSEALGKRLPYDHVSQLRRRLFELCPHFQRLDTVEPAPWGEFGRAGAIDNAPFALPIANFYMTDPISRASETMAQCTDVYVRGSEPKTGTHG
jgi:NADH-quinone oxidoreductase subunit G